MVQNEITELTRGRVSEALFLIGFGATWVLDVLWPGILVAFGIAWSASLALRKRYWAMTVVTVLLCIVPAAYIVLPMWTSIIPLSIVAMGAIGLARAFYLQGRSR